ncbi:hypothetical protein H4687_009381, partial [Streptomyces stelliscabiei]|nr:hypothetical protein [Streptomyces stelliscabiei]
MTDDPCDPPSESAPPSGGQDELRALAV